jgi:hypothetical protein
MFLIKREARVTPRKTSRSEENDKTELIEATIVNARRGRNVLGRGRLRKRGTVIRSTKKTSGNMDNGLTSVLPPRFVGKKGKLVTGNVKKRNPHAILIDLE